MNNTTALIFIDIQNDYFKGGSNPLSGSFEASLKAQQILEWFRNKHFPVIHVQHLSVRAGSTFFIPGTLGAEIHQHVSPEGGETIVTKHFPNSFRETILLEHLQSLQISDLVISGMMTHMCVDATVRAAKDFGFNCTLLSDACATKDLTFGEQLVNADEVHASFLAALSYYYAAVKPVDVFINELT